MDDRLKCGGFEYTDLIKLCKDALKKYDYAVNPYLNPKMTKEDIKAMQKNVNLVLIDESKTRIYNEGEDHTMYTFGDNFESYFISYSDYFANVKANHFIGSIEKLDIYFGGKHNVMQEYEIGSKLIYKIRQGVRRKLEPFELITLLSNINDLVKYANSITVDNINKTNNMHK